MATSVAPAGLATDGADQARSKEYSVTAPPPRSPHCLPDQLRLGFRQQRFGALALDLLAADLEHDRNRERRDMVERLMDDSALDAREHVAEALNVEQAGRGVGTRGAQQHVVALVLAQHVVDEVGGDRQLAARLL